MRPALVEEFDGGVLQVAQLNENHVLMATGAGKATLGGCARIEVFRFGLLPPLKAAAQTAKALAKLDMHGSGDNSDDDDDDGRNGAQQRVGGAVVKIEPDDEKRILDAKRARRLRRAKRRAALRAWRHRHGGVIDQDAVALSGAVPGSLLSISFLDTDRISLVTSMRVFHGGRLILLGDLDLSVQLVSWREKVREAE